MNLFDVYSLFPVTPVRAAGLRLWDDQGHEYLDLYGGHAVISIGHSHPVYVEMITRQLQQLAFYSNSVHNPLQEELALQLGVTSGYPEYQLFLCNSGAEANENALKLASFVTGRKKIIAFERAFHGRTSGAVAITANAKIQAPFNRGHEVVFLPWNDLEAVSREIHNAAAVIIEGIQGVGGIHVPDSDFLRGVSELCRQAGALFLLDEIQSGYGRTGKFFAHQHAGIQADLITIAKGMGNGFPVGGVLIAPEIKPWSGMLGTTFGGNYLACAASLAVLKVINEEGLMENAHRMGTLLIRELVARLGAHAVRGQGLMIGFDLPTGKESVRQELLTHHRIFTGEAKPATVRLLPALNLGEAEVQQFLHALDNLLK